MKGKALVVIAFMLVASIAVFGQANLTGKWQTDNVPAALEAQKNAPPAEPGARGGRGGGGGGQAIIIDLKADASGKITGTVTEVGNPPELMIESGMITGKMITWVTQPRGVTWNLEMTDDNTLSLTGRVIGNRGGGGGGGRGAGAGAGAGRCWRWRWRRRASGWWRTRRGRRPTRSRRWCVVVDAVVAPSNRLFCIV